MGGGGGKGGGGGGSSTQTVRYADYVEAKHQDFLNVIAAKRAAVIDNSPFASFSTIDIDVGFFGVGYVLSSFPSLYDMYGKFMAGLDVDVLYNQTYGDLMQGTVTQRLVSAEAKFLEDELVSNIIPRYEAGMRDINAVVSSSFVIGKALLESDRLKNVEKYSAGLQYALLPVVTDRWKAHLDWNRGVVMAYAEVMKLYVSAKMDTADYNQELKVKDRLWPFTVLEYERAAIGALQGATTTSTKVAGQSGAGRVISGALAGATMGGMIGGAIVPATPAVAATATAPAIAASAGGGPVGIVIGGLLGIAGAFI